MKACVSTQLRDGVLGIGECAWNYVHKSICVLLGVFTIYLEYLDLPS